MAIKYLDAKRIRGVASEKAALLRVETTDAINTGITRVTASGTDLPTALATATPYAYSYSGSGLTDYNIVPFDFTAYASFTMSFWIKPDAFDSKYLMRNQLAAPYLKCQFYEWGDHNMRCEYYDGSTVYNVQADLDADEWIHLVIVKDTSTLKLYVNGALIDTQAGVASGAITGSGYSSAWWLFATPDYSTSAYEGDALQFLVYNTALTLSQIQAIYNGAGSGIGTNTPSTTNLVLWYNFQQATSGKLENQINKEKNPENTLFEETDTRYIWWLQDNEWVMNAISRSTAEDNAVKLGGAVSAWVATAICESWNGSTWSSSMTNMPNARQMGGGRGNLDDCIFAGGDTGGTNNPSKDTYLWNGSAWASAAYPQMVEYHSEGYALGGNSQAAFAHSGSSGYTGSTPYQKQYSGIFDGSSWTASVTSSYGGQGTNGDGTPDDFFGGGGYNSAVSPTDVDEMESFNGTAWKDEADFPWNTLAAWHLYGAGMFCCSGVESALTQGNNNALSGNAVTYDGSAWAAAGDMTVSIKGGGFGGDSSYAIGAGFYPADTGESGHANNSTTYNGSIFTTVASLGTPVSHSGVGGNS